ncbi:uncharacterized protein EV154DRAFT_467451 [Mucor mucedo]|uniref:uncharacterized protein n=1 Tax=Mucor mucedo TaxID=29922 RepID=UPI00222030B1|nr:uncharacterized protein EV154DRAFT_467451 [Mucor mucedo]KAI7889393.1 hypothetical protein EV154DRAFT_467451 [Mucor mucedo]
MWSRKHKINGHELLDTVAIRQYFYLKTRERLLATEMYLKEAANIESINEEVELIEPGCNINEDMLDEENTPGDSDTENILSKNKEGPSTTNEGHKAEDEEKNADIKSMFTGLDAQIKWYLSTGKCVDNELYIFGLQCQSYHPSRNLILDPYDKNYIMYNVFTRDELQEIIDYKKKTTPLPSDELITFLNQFNLDSTEKIRAALGKNNQFTLDFDPQKDADKDWIIHTIHSLLREFEYGNMDRSHSEAWYQSHIWSIIESCFDKLKGVEAAIGESASFSSKRRMNEKRHKSAITSAPRLKCGYKCDLVFRQYDNGHNTPLEFGGSEAKPTIEEDFGSKFLQEGFLKLPYIFKDMLDVLLEKVGYDNRSSLLRTVGFIHSGLSCTMIELDRSTTDISRVSRGSTIEISNSVSNFGSTVLPAILCSWI